MLEGREWMLSLAHAQTRPGQTKEPESVAPKSSRGCLPGNVVRDEPSEVAPFQLAPSMTTVSPLTRHLGLPSGDVSDSRWHGRGWRGRGGRRGGYSRASACLPMGLTGREVLANLAGGNTV